MKVLVVGSGGREHALVRAINKSKSVTEVFNTPGSDGISKEATVINVESQDFDSLVEFIRINDIELVVVGPEQPLADGLSDHLRKNGISTFGPSKIGSQLESSKIFSKEFMTRAGVPTAKYEVVSSVAEVKEKLKKFAPPWVLKADGLAGGKGVFICQTEDSLSAAAKEVFEDKKFGDSGERALLEEFQNGWELSFLILTNGRSYECLPLAQDHKRLLDGDLGPNTGGMGVVAPIAIDSKINNRIIEEIVEPSVKQIHKENIDYRGVLYIGVMVTKDGPTTLEYNVRFGDPEAQVLLPLLEGEWGQVLKSVADGELPKLQWKKTAACVLVLAAENYPESPKKGVPVEGIEGFNEKENVYLLHAGTRYDPQLGWVTNGGRVLNLISVSSDIHNSVKGAYGAVTKITSKGMHYRKDIGAKQL